MTLRATWQREVRLRRRSGGWAVSIGLFVLSSGLMPLALGRDPELLASAGPALLWLTACLSLLIGLDGLYDDDLRSGALGIYRLSPLPLSVVLLLKISAGWLVSCLPLIMVSPLLLFAFGSDHIWTGALGFLLGTPALALLAGALGALGAGLRRGTALLVFLALPMLTPALVFGPASAGDAPFVPLLVLSAFSLQTLAICPFVAAAAIREQMN